MANTKPKALQNLQATIHVLYENDSTTPDVGSDPWNLRLVLINQKISDWGDTEDVLWNELFVHYVSTSQIALNTQDYTLSADDISIPGSFVRFIHSDGTITFVDVVNPNDMTKFRENARVVYFTGDPGNGYTMHLGWTPVAGDTLVGCTFAFDYYASATTLSNATDTPQMNDCNYIIYGVVATLHALDENDDLSQRFDTMAQNAMDNMKIRNAMLVPNGDMRLDDVELVRDNARFGV